MSTSPEWNEGAIECLRMMWAAGMPASEIGRRMGRSKNAIIGKAHRLKLTERPSPIGLRATGPRKPRVRRVARLITLPALPSIVVAQPIELARPEKPKPTPAPRVARMPNERQCEWLEGNTKPFVRCPNKAVFRRPYCSDCCNCAYVRKTAEGQVVAA